MTPPPHYGAWSQDDAIANDKDKKKDKLVPRALFHGFGGKRPGDEFGRRRVLPAVVYSLLEDLSFKAREAK